MTSSKSNQASGGFGPRREVSVRIFGSHEDVDGFVEYVSLRHGGTCSAKKMDDYFCVQGNDRIGVTGDYLRRMNTGKLVIVIGPVFDSGHKRI